MSRPSCIWYFLTVIMLFISSAPVRAQNIWIVSNEPGYASADFNSIQEAVESASSGDLIYIHGTPNPYDESVLINKKLHLVGQGYWKPQNNIPDPNQNATQLNGSMTLQPGSDSSIIEGIMFSYFYGSIFIESNNVIHRYNSHPLAGTVFLVNQPTGVSIYGNYIGQCLNGSGTNINVFNNICPGSYDGSGNFWQNSESNSDCLFQNNALLGQFNPMGLHQINNATIRNNIFFSNNHKIANSYYCAERYQDLSFLVFF